MAMVSLISKSSSRRTPTPATNRSLSAEARCAVFARWLAVATLTLPPTGSLSADIDSRAITTIYVGAHFELREDDQPVKYVLRDENRVARITGTLSPQPRLQRLRLRAGWNLVSLAVTAAGLMQQLRTNTPTEGAHIEAYRWEPTTRLFQAVGDHDSAAAGSVLWVHSKAPRTVGITGDFPEPANQPVSAGGAFAPSFGVEAWSLAVPEGVSLWRFDSANGRWQIAPGGDLAIGEEIPKVLPPGEAFYLHSSEQISLERPDPHLGIRYYHPDHLGSTAAITDAGGNIVEERAYFPFGSSRSEYRPKSILEAYQFTGMEKDRESALFSFGARFYNATLPRFTRADPLGADIPMDWLSTPQKLNAYAYVANNPINFVDPSGLDRKKPGPAKVLIVYGYDMFNDFENAFGGTQTRNQYAGALKRIYAQETGKGANVTVKNIESKEALQKALEGSTYDTIIFNTHGYSNTKAIQLGADTDITPADIAGYLSNNKQLQNIYFYGCNTATSGFAETLSGQLTEVNITGTTGIVAQRFKRSSQNKYTGEENRDLNRTFLNRKVTYDARIADTKNSTLPRE